MILLPLLNVVFVVNLVGADPGHVQKQLAMVLEDNRAVARKVAPADAAALRATRPGAPPRSSRT